jgi:copper transport protein
VGVPRPAADDPLALEIPVRKLGKGVYTVTWKVVSAIDGHATDGTFAFGVQASPGEAAATESTTTQSSSRFELVARWVFLLGIVALLGGAVAGAARFGGSTGSDLALAGGGWAASVTGLLLLAEAQRSTAGTSFGGLLDTSIGHALIWRSAGLLVAGLALLVARRAPGRRRPALALAALATLGTIVAHVDGGHAAAGDWSSLVSVSAQAAHFAAAGIWFGGLAALLLGIRGAPPAVRSAALRRFGVVALGALFVVFATGTLRAVDELNAWGDLPGTGYGRAILAKVLLIGLIAALAARGRHRAELVLAVLALALAALLGTLAPPVAGGAAAPGLSASGADFGTTTRVELTAASDEPGPNLFTARVEDYDSGDPLAGAAKVSLRFTPLDDPGVEPSSLSLEPGPDDAFVGSGPNLAFDGRWAVDVVVERGGATVSIPLELDLPIPEQFVSVQRIPGQIAKYTMSIGPGGGDGYLRLEPDPQRAGPNKLYVTAYTLFGGVSHIDQIVVTAAPEGEPLRQIPTRRLNPGRFVADAELVPGPLEVGVVAYARDGTRLRGVFRIEIPD